MGTAGNNTGANWNESLNNSGRRIIGKRIVLDKYGYKEQDELVRIFH